MPLTPITPDQIEERMFPLEERGYSRDAVRAFLLEIAAGLRDALRSSQLATRSHLPDNGDGDRSGDPFARLGERVADLLRAADESAGRVRDDASTEAQALREEAEADARGIRQRAETEAAAQMDRARRVLIVAQEQAEAVLADSRREAAEMVAAATAQADELGREAAERLQRRADDLEAAEHRTLQRLHDLSAAVNEAVAALGHRMDRPVLDLTGPDPSTHPARDPGDAQRTLFASMTRNAVARASEAARQFGDEAASV